jgi:hypothetical protein
MVAAGTATNANRVQALISSIFSFAVDADLVGAIHVPAFGNAESRTSGAGS